MKKKIVFIFFILVSFLLVACKPDTQPDPNPNPEDSNDEKPDEKIDKTPKKVYKITFENYDMVVDTVDVTEGELITFPNLDSKYSRVLYWTIKGDLNKFEINTLVNSDLTLTPIFEHANCISFPYTKIEDLYVFAGEKMTRPSDPTRANYEFVGWYEDYQLSIPFNFDKEYGYVQHITVHSKWKAANADLYYRDILANNELIYEVYVTEYAKGEVVVPSYYLGVEIYEVHLLGSRNEAISISLPRTIHNALPDFFISSYNLEEIKVDINNRVYQSKDGVLYRNPDAIVFYPSNKAGITYHTEAVHISSKAFSNTRNLKYLFLDKALQIYNDAFSNSSIENIVVSEGAIISSNAFRNYKGNVFLNDAAYNFLFNPDIKVYLKGEWSLVSGLPIPNN